MTSFERSSNLSPTEKGTRGLVQLTRLRLTGFKSFIDPTEVEIEPGLTGIVGPNGCGKSNLVEALRWVMAETSPKAMRGTEMDDVIFGGTADRPTRNIAEVSLLVDNSERRAPAAFNEDDQLEISRRIERGAGSHYRVNGREVRARDVQVLFADAATGAHSTAIVSQGQIGSLIAARPADRRALLEEAAGITGIHSRRHEAELRLRAAENNLERLDDVIVTLDGQLQGLRRQARQAARYRNLSDHMRRAEALYLHIRWLAASADGDDAKARLEEAERRLAALTRAAGAAATHQAEAAADLPSLRQAEAEAAAALHRLAVARDGLDAEDARIATAEAECETRLAHIADDLAHEQVRAADAAAALERLEAERTALMCARDGQAEAEAALAARLAAAQETVAGLEAATTALTEELAAAESRREALAGERTEAAARLERLAERARQLATERTGLETERVEDDALDAATHALEAARADREATRARAQEAEAARTRAEAGEAAAREAATTSSERRAKVRAEAAVLTELLSISDTEIWPPLVDRLTVEGGYELALGVALGDDLTAPDDEAAPVHWRTLAPFATPAPLPAGATPLADHTRAPDALARRLSQIGVVRDRDQGDALCGQLVQGQRLVSIEGALWRWDGFTVAPGASTAAATRLAHRNRLGQLRDDLVAAEQAAAAAQHGLDAAQGGSREAVAAERAAQGAIDAALTALEAARDGHDNLARAAAAVRSRLDALVEAEAGLDADRRETEARAQAIEATLAALADTTAERERLVTERAHLDEHRAALAELQAERARTAREAEDRAARLAGFDADAESWHARAAEAERRGCELAERGEAARAEQARLAARPAEIEAQRHALLDRIGGAEAQRAEAADRLAEAETRLAECDRALKAAETGLGDAREERVRCAAGLEQAAARLESLRERIAERLADGPDALPAIAGLREGAELPAVETVESRLERLNRERENMGPVNLRAEQEAQELQEQIATLQSEREDLLSAIARLRHGIAELNREGRERLMASFVTVDRHFRSVFTQLFGGGTAHLKLTEADDPLEAGLEIMASPPGKRLQVLSLLSGGERALTALSLMFAVFLTNPAPICVLDEVDASLDDANVDRFCALLEEIAHRSATRFVLVTHHRMTMARMDRLFGVTMAEPGISQLVSVNLQGAETLRAAE